EINDTIKTGTVNRPKTYKVRKKNGDFVFVETNAIPLNKNGEFYAILGIGHDVSVYKKVEQNLLASEEKYRHLFNQSPFNIILFDSKGNFIESNGVLVKKLSSQSGIDFQGKNFLEIATYFQNSEQLIKLFSERLKILQQGEDLDPVEFSFNTMDGEKIWLNWQSSRLEIENQSYIQVIFQDITERKVAEQKLVESEEKFRVISEESMVGIAILQDYIYQFINERALEIFGYKQEEVRFGVAGDFLNSINPEDRGRISKQIMKIQEGLKGSVIHNPFRGVKKNGDKIWIDMYARSIMLNNKSAVLIFFIDFTDQVKTEEKLRESEEKFRTLFEKADEGIILANTDNEQIISANKKICEMLGYSQQELTKMHFADLHPQESLHYIDEKFEQELDEISMVNDIPMKRKDGSVFYCNVNSSQIEIGDQPYFLGFFSDVTKRMEAEQKLKESEEKFRSIAEYSDAEISIIQDGVFKYINQKALDTLGYIAEEVDSWKPYELIEKIIHPNQREIVLNLTKRIQSGDKDYMFHDEIQFLDISGNDLWLDTYTRSITFQGRPAALSCALNITDKKKAEDKLKESEKVLRDFVHNATDSISIWDANLNLIEINDVASDPWDSPNKPVRGIHMSDLAPLIKETGRYDKYLEVIRTGEPISFDNVGIPPKVGERYFNIKAFKVGSGLGIIGTEITDHIRFEQELKESEEKFRNIAEQSFMGIVILQEGKIKYMNKVLAQMSEYPIEEMLRWPERLIAKMVHPDDVGYILKRLQSNREATMSQLSQNTFRIITSSGEIRWLEDYTRKIIFQGKAANLISVVDVTDKKKAEQIIIEENKRLLELEELRKDIITRVSHELKTPMTSIYGANQILTRLYMDEIGEEAQKYIEIGLRGTLRMKQLIDNLLDVSRLDAKKLGLRLQEENLVELIIDCVKDMNYLATDRQLKIKLDLPNEAYHNIDRLRFRQVLSNIISNAIKNTPVSGEILISIIEDNEYHGISIKDTGVGITEKEREKLFEKFGKIERYGMDLGVDIEGSGLGLYISKEIVDLHGGQIIVESEGRNKGTNFIIRLYKR
ncbi:MAG: PAS domain S-box protein, partial [Candidatus Hodarchaeales archaeon]